MILIVHGGAGARKPGKQALKKLHESLSSGYNILRNGGTALDAVTGSIRALEDSGTFNAGLGANLQIDGVRRLDASVMEGRELRAGSVIGLEGTRNPIVAARSIMNLPNVMLTNIGAKKIVDREKIPTLPPTDKSNLLRLRQKTQKGKALMQLYKHYFSTVGAVALDEHGDLAAGASTGGIAAMLPGRVGDSPIIGAGVYAENSLGAVSCTGMGEYIIRLSLAKEICMNMKDLSPYKAASFSLRRILRMGGEAGVIVMSKEGGFTIAHTTEYMASGYAYGKRIVVKEGFKKRYGYQQRP